MAQSIITFLVGVATFITGMNMMSSGLKKVTGRSIKRIFKKTQNNRFISMAMGAGATALIQSSAATSIMAIGFISAGVMSIYQGMSVILGAYIGTTVTGVLVSFSSFDFGQYLVLLSVIGVIMMFFTNEKIKSIGEVVTGLGLLFFGLSTVTGAFKSSQELLNVFQNLFGNIDKLALGPLLFVIVGALFTALVQSSSASTGIIIIMAGSGAVSISSALYFALGATIGTVITTILASIGGSFEVKKTAKMCLIIRIITAFIATAIVWIFESNGQIISTLFRNIFGNDELAIAMFMVIYNIIFMSIVLLLLKPIMNVFNKLIVNKDEIEKKKALLYIDERLLNTPSIAMMQLKKEVIHMYELAYSNYLLGYKAIVEHDLSNNKVMLEVEDNLDYINNEITNFLIGLNSNVQLQDAKMVGSYFHIINDIERIGDHAYNFLESANKMIDNSLDFSSTAKKGFEEMQNIIVKMFEIAKTSLELQKCPNIKELHDLEEKTDKLKLDLSNAHYARITKKECKNELSPFFSTFISELERVADHIVNIGYAFENPTGDID